MRFLSLAYPSRINLEGWIPIRSKIRRGNTWLPSTFLVCIHMFLFPLFFSVWVCLLGWCCWWLSPMYHSYLHHMMPIILGHFDLDQWSDLIWVDLWVNLPSIPVIHCFKRHWLLQVTPWETSLEQEIGKKWDLERNI